MKEFKIRIKNSDHWNLVESELFKNGYEWAYGGKTHVPFSSKAIWIYSDNGLNIYWSHEENCEYTKYIPEYDLTQTVSYSFNKINRKQIKIGKHTYFEDDIINALDDLKEALKIKPIS